MFLKNWLLLLNICFALFLVGCGGYARIKDGRQAFELKQYAVAIRLLTDEVEKGKSYQGENAFIIAESYNKLSQFADAATWYKRAYDEKYGNIALLKYAQMLRCGEKYDEAIALYTQLGRESNDPNKYRVEIAGCKVANDWLEEKKDSPYSVEDLAVNSAYSDFAPIIYRNNTLLFTSDRPMGDNKVYSWTGKGYQGIYKAESLQSAEVELFNQSFISEGNNGVIAFNPAFDEAYFSRCGENPKDTQGYCRLMFSKYEEGKWSEPDYLPFVEEGINYLHPTLSADGNILIFSSDKNKLTNGYDLFLSKRTAVGWEEMSPLSATINSQYNEVFPFIDNDTLYFSSDVPGSMGGLDIYSTYLNNRGQWTPPLNLKSPVNSGSDDFGFIVDKYSPKAPLMQAQGYLSSNRPGGKGSDDIYRWEMKFKPPVVPVVNDSLSFVLNLDIQGKEYIADEKNPGLKQSLYTPLSNAIYLLKENKVLIDSGTVDFKGNKRFKIKSGRQYEVQAFKDGYLTNNIVFNTMDTIGLKGEQVVNKSLILEKIYVNTEIRIDNIYYDYDKWNIRKDAEPALDSLANILELNSKIRIQLSSHTDCRGNDKYNETLSQKRAQSAVDYLIKKGISKNRLIAKGYGESSPAIRCECVKCTEDEHQINRRTTFKIIAVN